MRKGLNMKMAAMGLALASMVACTGKTTTDATCCALTGRVIVRKELAAKNARTHVILTIKK